MRNCHILQLYKKLIKKGSRSTGLSNVIQATYIHQCARLFLQSQLDTILYIMTSMSLKACTLRHLLIRENNLHDHEGVMTTLIARLERAAYNIIHMWTVHYLANSKTSEILDDNL
jgi:hypothetical protein